MNQQLDSFLAWIKTKELIPCNSDKLYEEMESQSSYCLPVVYQPFNPKSRAHWRDIGLTQDFLHSTNSFGKMVLDFGPGDGWPSLVLAPFVQEVVGVDASQKRVSICGENARRMNITNASFVHYAAGNPLPFSDESFDAVTAASSIEQCPDPKAVLSEFYRILKPGGRLRMFYEGLKQYEGNEAEIWFQDKSEKCSIIVYIRDIAMEKVVHYKLDLNISGEACSKILSCVDGSPQFKHLTSQSLKELEPFLEAVYTYTLMHPSCKTWLHLLSEAGFKTVKATHDGGSLAVSIYDSMTEAEKEMSLEEAYKRVGNIMPWIYKLEAPICSDPLILAIK